VRRPYATVNPWLFKPAIAPHIAAAGAVFGQAWAALERGGRDGEFAFPVSDIGRREPRGR
jgi:hypothetical protein